MCGKNVVQRWQRARELCSATVLRAVCPQGTDLEILKQSSRLVHYCATPLLFDPVFRKQIQEEQIVQPPAKVFLGVSLIIFNSRNLFDFLMS